MENVGRFSVTQPSGNDDGGSGSDDAPAVAAPSAPAAPAEAAAPSAARERSGSDSGFLLAQKAAQAASRERTTSTTSRGRFQVITTTSISPSPTSDDDQGAGPKLPRESVGRFRVTPIPPGNKRYTKQCSHRTGC